MCISQEPTESSKQSIRARYLRHVTGYQPIRDQYFLVGVLQYLISSTEQLILTLVTLHSGQDYVPGGGYYELVFSALGHILDMGFNNS